MKQRFTSNDQPFNQQHYDAIIIGGGAAGLMCAATAGQRGRSVLLLEHTKKVGKKILMSGGGRCNFTNLTVLPEHYLSQNRHFCKSALSRYTTYDFMELVDRYQLQYHEKTKGQLFCDHSSKDILSILIQECEQAGVEIRTSCKVNTIRSLSSEHSLSSESNQTTDAETGSEERFEIHVTDNLHKHNLNTITCHALVVATGGLSIPTLGATGFGYKIAEQFGLSCTPRDASLVPFTLTEQWNETKNTLSGISLDVAIECNNQRFEDPLLFTHRGLSGPAVLQISNYWHSGDEVLINFMPNRSLSDTITQWQSDGVKAELKNLLAQYLPKRFVQHWLELSVGNRPVHQYQHADIEQLSNHFHRFPLIPNGTEGYRTAEVTRGGINTDHVSSKTMEAKKVPGLYFIGEVLDVTGWLGGYNFQWAWASGFCAGQYV